MSRDGAHPEADSAEILSSERRTSAAASRTELLVFLQQRLEGLYLEACPALQCEPGRVYVPAWRVQQLAQDLQQLLEKLKP